MQRENQSVFMHFDNKIIIIREKKMTTDPLNAFFTPKHQKLYRIANTLEKISWIGVIIYSVLGINKLFETSQNLWPKGLFLNEMPLDLLFLNIFQWNDLFSALLLIFKGGAVYLVMNGLSFGLKMITETDLNFRNYNEGDNHE
jgi:hypothetical protein